MKAHLLSDVRHTSKDKKTEFSVIGAGNVTMDAARTAKRLGAKEVHGSTEKRRRDARENRGVSPCRRRGNRVPLANPSR